MPPQITPAVKIGFLGGSFDPVHFGHLCAAQDACEHLELDRVFFVPAAQAPLKGGLVPANDSHRLAMLGLALEDYPRFSVSDLELRRGGTSYTVDTALELRKLYPEDRLFWIIGADQLSRLSQWMRISELVTLVEFVCLDRPGYPGVRAPEIPGLRLHRCPGHLLDISSTELRARAREGKSLDCFMPHKSIVYLRKNLLYLRNE